MSDAPLTTYLSIHLCPFYLPNLAGKVPMSHQVLMNLTYSPPTQSEKARRETSSGQDILPSRLHIEAPRSIRLCALSSANHSELGPHHALEITSNRKQHSVSGLDFTMPISSHAVSCDASNYLLKLACISCLSNLQPAHFVSYVSTAAGGDLYYFSKIVSKTR